jgi:hypothetical protein
MDDASFIRCQVTLPSSRKLTFVVVAQAADKLTRGSSSHDGGPDEHLNQAVR